MHLRRHPDLANMNVYVCIYGFRYKNGWGRGEVYLSTLPSPDAFSICKYLETAMSGIYVKVTMPEPAVRLFQSAPYQSCGEINETVNKTHSGERECLHNSETGSGRGI